MKTKKELLIIIVVLAIVGSGVFWTLSKKSKVSVTNFEECVAAGNPIRMLYPTQCSHQGVSFTEDIGNELEKMNFIRIDNPRPNQIIKSPLLISGEARGSWFFEASFPVDLVDSDGRILVQSFATAQGEWMTSDFVPFTTMLTFTTDENIYGKKGTLILRKDNPSGLPEHDDALEIPVTFAE